MPDEMPPVPDDAEGIRLTHDLEVIAALLAACLKWLRVGGVTLIIIALLMVVRVLGG
jgi:hypothetical protein